MDSQNEPQLQERQFLKAKADEWGFSGDIRITFLERFDRCNLCNTNEVFAETIKWNKDLKADLEQKDDLPHSNPKKQEPIVNRKQKLKDELQNIVKKLKDLKIEGCPQFEQQGRGRRRKGESFWEKIFTWLWDDEYPKWRDKRQIDRDEAFKNVTDGIPRTVEELNGTLSVDQQKPVPQGERDFWHEVSVTLLKKYLDPLTTSPLLSDKKIPERKQLYVPLGLVERKKPPSRKGDVSPERGSDLYSEGGGDELPGQKFDSEQETQIGQRFEHEQFLEQVLRRGQSRNQGKRIAIIGEPGAGKTTLLQQIAHWLAEEMEQPVVIWVPLAALQEQKLLESYLLETWLKAVARYSGQAEASETLKSNFVTQFNQGRVWLLLDGLDEMQSSGNPLSEIHKQILEGGLLQQAQILLTCRLNLWEGNRNALYSLFDIYRTLDFSYPQQVEQFIEQWFRSNAQEEEKQGQRLCHALNEQGKERIRDSVKNPLRLTLLCFNWSLSKGKLPETKAALYQQFVTDIYKWKSEEFPTTEKQREQLNAKLAELSREAIDKEKNRFRLRPSFICRFLDNPDEKDPLFPLALNLGWLNNVGLDADSPRESGYAFFHPTFEEYFAALAINDWKFFLHHIPENPDDPNANYRIFEPQWKEVFLLWLGREDVLKEQKEQLIQALVEFGDGCGNFYDCRAYLLAAEGIAEFRDCSRADEIVKQIVEWSFGYFDIEKQQWGTFIISVENRARAALLEMECTKTTNALVKLICSFPSEEYVHNILRSLAEIGKRNPTAIINALVELIYNSQSEYICWQALWYLGDIDSGNPTAIINALVELAQDSQSEKVRMRAAERLGKIDSGNPAAINALVELTQDSQSEYIRWCAAQSLGDIDPGNPAAINALVESSRNSQSEKRRRQAVYSLEKIASGNPTAINALVELAKDSQDENVRWRAAKSLVNIDSGNLTAINTLVELAQDSQDESIRCRAAQSLLEIDSGNLTAINTLVELAQDSQDENVRCHAASDLFSIDSSNSTAMHALVELIHNSQDENIRRHALVYLGGLELSNPTAINALVELIHNSQHEDIRRHAVKSLQTIASDHPIAIPALVELAQDSQDEIVRWRAAQSLVEIDSGNLIAINTLVELARDSQDENVRCNAAESLGDIDSDNPTAINTLVELINNSQDENVLCDAAATLKKILGEAQMAEVVSVLKDCLSNETDEDDFGRYEHCFNIIWHCAQTLPYPTFYQACHLSPYTPESQSLNLADLPKCLRAALDSDSSLEGKVQLICIDGSDFVERYNPALKIYNEMRSSGCREYWNGKPREMAQLQDYWDDIMRDSDRTCILVFYESRIPLEGFSDNFLNDLSKFRGAICVISNQLNLPLQFFSPNQPNLVADVVEWVRNIVLENS